MEYAVIIRTKNSEKTIRHCIESLATQTIIPEEIIVVDSGSQDSTLDILRTFNIRVIYYPSDIVFNYSKALNIGISDARSDFILIMSSHVNFLHKDSVKFMAEALRDEKCKAVSYHLIKHPINYDDSAKIEINNVDILNFKGHAMYNSCSMIRKLSWQNYPFNEDIPNCEDQDFAYHFIKKGYYTAFITSPRVCYRNPYYNSTKEAVNRVTIGRLMYPYWVSKEFMLKTLKAVIMKLAKRQSEQARHEFLVFWHILKYRFFGLYNKQSIYNKKLK